MRVWKLSFAFFGICVLAGAATASNRLEDFNRYRNYLEAKHLAGDETEARRVARDLQESLPDGDPLRSLVQSTDRVEPSPTEIAFSTGSKQETYCRGKGLVMAEGQHNDGSFSRLLLVSEDRLMEPDQYSQMKDGSQWIYELSNSFRPAVRSEIWQSWGQPNGYTIFELRRLADNKVDQGHWDVEWSPGNMSSRHSVNTFENAPEPSRALTMAMQYQRWGSVKMGYDLVFKVGAKDTNIFKVRNGDAEYYLKSSREVAEQIPEVTFQDASSTSHVYQDCFRVSQKIEFVGLEKPAQL